MKYYIYSTKTKKQKRVSKKTSEKLLTKEVLSYCRNHFDADNDGVFEDYFNWEIEIAADIIDSSGSVHINDFIFSIEE